MAGLTLAATAWVRRDLPAVLPLDDAYITLHSAQALLAGGDASYGSPVLSGITSAPHLLLVTASQALAPGERSVLALAWLGLALYAMALAVFARRVGPLWGALLVLCGLTAGVFLPYHALNGLETGWALAALTWTLVLASPAAGAPADTAPSGGRRATLGLLLGTLPFLRPELGPFALALLAARFFEARRAGGEASRSWMSEASAAAGAASLWAVWYWLSTGSPVPSSALIKAAFRAESCRPWLERLAAMRGGLAESLPGAAALGAAFLLVRPARTGHATAKVGFAGLVAIGAFLGASLALFPFAPQMQEGRYTIVFVPLLVFGFAHGLLAERPGLRRLGRTLLLIAVAYDVAQLPAAFSTARDATLFTADELAETARWLGDHLPPDARVLVHDAGYAAFATRFALVDAVGLKTPSSAEIHRRVTWASCGERRGDALAEIAQRGRVTHLVLLAEWEQRFGFTRALAEHGFTVNRIRDGHTGYSVYALAPPN